jgi:thiosulfate/3-mercaptopyruvate sulfurtransferase
MDAIPLIEPTALNDLIGQPHVRLLDASYAISTAGGTPFDAWLGARIDHAQFFDIDAVADRKSSLPHMLPTPDEFAAAVSALGISNDDHVIVYDQTGIAMAAARVWWTFRVFGHDNVSVLNGGLPAWRAAYLPLNTEPPRPVAVPGRFTASLRPEMVRSKAQVMDTLRTSETVVVDARSPERFAGLAGEPRPGLRSGHIPGSLNLPFTGLLDPETGGLRGETALAPLLSVLEPYEDIVSSCGSGVTACVLALAMYRTGRKNVAIYDGSWAEWGQQAARTPVDKFSVKV